jgi:23S rRNA (adenine2503-C2)-methyltransferase
MNLLGCTQEELIKIVTDLGEPAYRAKQLYSRLQKGVQVNEMTQLPSKFRAALLQEHSEGYLKTVKKLESTDGTVKYLFLLDDETVIESVLMKYKHGNTVCVSTQAGCRMGCAFCASCYAGLMRDLTAGEMLSQVLNINKDVAGYERAISNVVLMGSGEPFDNYDNTVRFIRLLHDVDGLNISLRNISLSTCGIVPRILDFTKEDLPVTLCISLHAADDETRKMILPIAKTYSIAEILDAAKKYYEKTGRRIIIEYTLMQDVNDKASDAVKLKKLLNGLNCHINLIPCNESEKGFKSPSKKVIYAFLSQLAPLSATVRRSLGSQVEGACGQLRRRHIQDESI